MSNFSCIYLQKTSEATIWTILNQKLGKIFVRLVHLKKERKKDSELFPCMRMLLSLRNFNWQQSYSLQVLYRFLMP